MFKKVLQSISKSLSRPAVQAVPAAPRAEAPPSAKFPAPSAGKTAARSAPKSVEELLGIDAKMGKEQIRDQLKLLYRRYNRAASSLNDTTRAEADTMLDAIVAVREKHFGEI